MYRAPAYAHAIKYLAIFAICVLAFSIRLFSVVKYESVIHEFDPYFNYRVTQFLTKEGLYNLWNWFDDRTWYPLGRVIGGTVYPGLIYTAGAIYKILHALNIPIHVQEVCVFTAPLFSAFCALTTYGFVKEVRSEGAGLLAAAFVATVPSYISRSVAGSYDNEGVAIFALVNVFNMFMKTVNTGSLYWATMTLLAYFYMVLSWGGYSFIINLLPIFCLVCIFSGRLNSKLYVAFAPVIVIGTLMAASIPVVGFNAVLMSEHFGAFLACGVLHAVLLVQFVQARLTPQQFAYAKYVVLVGGLGTLGVVGLLVVGYISQSPTFGWTGRSLSLLDPTYASKYIPIIASVSEHQPTSWPSYLTDLHLLTILTPAGIIACFQNFTMGALFLVLYGITAVYFSGVMVRLMLVLAPATACLAGVGASELLSYLVASLKAAPQEDEAEEEDAAGASVDEGKGKELVKVGKDKGGQRTSGAGDKKEKKRSKKGQDRMRPVSSQVALLGIGLLTFGLVFYVVHCIYVSSDMYSAPSIVIQSHTQSGTYVFDDFREAYAWLRHNTPEDAKVASWWDYGYQTTAMANRTIVVDNNTWNNTHIATVGRAMSSPEAKAWRIYRSIDVDYVFVVFGGLVGYPSDDINKFLWMVRIGGGVYPDIKESDYLTNGDYTVAQGASPTMLNSLMYKLSYYDFADMSQAYFGQRGMDRVRNYQVGKLGFSLKYFEEVFTSQHWMMRIYRVRDRPLRDAALPNPHRPASKAEKKKRRVKAASA